ncbi:hypothetical protein Peur_007224 [Populus x canadensis]
MTKVFLLPTGQSEYRTITSGSIGKQARKYLCLGGLRLCEGIDAGENNQEKKDKKTREDGASIDAGEKHQEKKDAKTREDSASIDAGENHQEKKDEKRHTVEINISCCGGGCGGDCGGD